MIRLVNDIEKQTMEATKQAKVESLAYKLCKALDIPQWSSFGKDIWKACQRAKSDVHFVDTLSRFMQSYEQALKLNSQYPDHPETLKINQHLQSQYSALCDSKSSNNELAEALFSLMQKGYAKWIKIETPQEKVLQERMADFLHIDPRNLPSMNYSTRQEKIRGYTHLWKNFSKTWIISGKATENNYKTAIRSKMSGKFLKRSLTKHRRKIQDIFNQNLLEFNGIAIQSYPPLIFKSD